MVGTLLLRGMLVGVLAGIMCFGFLKVFGEPQVDRAIAFETQMDAAKAHDSPQAEPEPELVSRPVQAGLGLFTGVSVYSAAFGGLFALAFAFVYGRAGSADPRVTAVLLAAAGFVALYLVPSLKYPANPPSVGEPDTIGLRTALYFTMMALSLGAMVGAGMLRRRLVVRVGAWNATLIAAVAFLLAVAIAGLLLPGVNEVPEQFPATVLWRFRVASMGSQALMWAILGLVFGALTQHEAASRRGFRFSPASS